MNCDSSCGIRESLADLDRFVDVELVGFDHVKIQGKKGVTDESQDVVLSSRLDASGAPQQFLCHLLLFAVGFR